MSILLKKMKNELNAAIIGLGVGERHISAYELDKRCKVTKLCDFNEEKLFQIGKKYPKYKLTTNPNEVLDDPEVDIVSVASYDNYHAEQVIKAVKSGKHVFVEKPLCLYYEELVSIVEALSNNPKVKLSSNFVLRKSPQFISVKQEIDSKKFGTLYYLEADYNYGRLHKLTNGWRGEIPFYSVCHGGAIHMVDLIKWLSGKTIKKVMAIGNKITTKNTIFRYPDMVTSLLKFNDDLIAKVTANFGSVCPHHHQLSVYGTKATFIHNYQGGAYYKSRDSDVNEDKLNLQFQNLKKIEVQKSFISSILDGTKPEVTSQEVLDVMAISLAIEKSLNSNNWESVKYIKPFKINNL